MKILVIDPLYDTIPDVEEAAAGAGVELVFRRSVKGTLPDHGDYAGVDAVLNCRSAHKLPAEIIAKLDKCRCIAQGGVGYGHVDLKAAGERGIAVINTPDYGTTEVADHAVALSLSLLRGIQAYDRRLRRSNDSWDARLLKTVKRLGGVRVGIVGMGRIGTTAALRFQSFGMKVGYYDPHLPVGHNLSYGWERFDNLGALLARSDLLSIHCLLNDETRGMIDASAIAALPEGAVLVNTARGGIVDFDAVHAALKNGHLNAAGLDVFDEEPLDREDALIKAWAAGEEWLDEKLILTPHSAFYSTASILDIRRLSMTYLMDYLRNGRLRTCVNESTDDAAVSMLPTSIEGLRQMARRHLPSFAFDYLEGGAGQGRTLARNRAALDAWALLPRTLRDVSRVEVATRLFGFDMAAPVMVAPTGVAGMMRPGADAMLARAAAKAGLPFILSAASNMPVEQVAAAGGQVWMQIYPLRDREAAARLAQRAKAAGCVGLVLTVDTPVAGIRHWEAKHFSPSGRPRLRTRLDALRHPSWLAGTLRHGAPRFPNIDIDLPDGAARTAQAERKAINEGKDPAFTFDDLARFRDGWKGPLIVKGMVAPEDVARAASLGIDAVSLSNHGGRQLDGMVSTVEMLPACLEAAGTMPLLLDGGIRDGVDVAKVLALGAKGVLAGRVPLYGVAAAGEAGASRALELLVLELRRVLALLGHTDVASLTASSLASYPERR